MEQSDAPQGTVYGNGKGSMGRTQLTGEGESERISPTAGIFSSASLLFFVIVCRALSFLGRISIISHLLSYDIVAATIATKQPLRKVEKIRAR